MMELLIEVIINLGKKERHEDKHILEVLIRFERVVGVDMNWWLRVNEIGTKRTKSLQCIKCVMRQLCP